MMRDDKGSNRWKSETFINAGTGIQDCTLAQRKTMREGLRILARIIARAHLRRQADRSSAPAPGPPPGESRD